jgi:hypothetical protein
MSSNARPVTMASASTISSDDLPTPPPDTVAVMNWRI